MLNFVTENKPSKMSKFLFVVQGEGRGHLTQAISLYEILNQAGHQVVSVMVGIDDDQNLPSFFREKIQVEINTFPAPSLVYGQTKAVKVWNTISTHAKKLGKYRKSVQFLAQKVEQHQPDVGLSSAHLADAGVLRVVPHPL